MDEERKREVNHENAKRSTGPRTAAGKQRSSMNALRHGLLAKRLLLGGESDAELERLRQGIRKDLRPVGELEEELAERIVSTVWRGRRAHKVELGLWDWRGTVSGGKTTLSDVFFMDSQNDQSLQKLSRYSGTLNREFHRSLAALRQAQEVRKARSEEEEWIDPELREVESAIVDGDDGVEEGGCREGDADDGDRDDGDDGDGDDDGGGGDDGGSGAEQNDATRCSPEAAADAARLSQRLGEDALFSDAESFKAQPKALVEAVRAEMAGGRKRYDDMSTGEKTLFAVRNHSHVMAFDDMLTEAMSNKHWMERLGPRDLVRMMERFNSTMWQTVNGINKLLAEDDKAPHQGH